MDIDYSVKGNKALSEVYAENPVTEQQGVLSKKEGIKALLKAYTNENIRYTGVLNLPVFTSKIWIYSESYGLPTCIETQVGTSGVSFNLEEYFSELRKNKFSKAIASKSVMVRDVFSGNPYHIQTLGQWDNGGTPYYAAGIQPPPLFCARMH